MHILPGDGKNMGSQIPRMKGLEDSKYLKTEPYEPIMEAMRYGETKLVEILLRCPLVDLDVVDDDGNHLEEITENELILDQLWTFRSVQQRMILRDSLLTRQAGSVPSLHSLSRDAVLLILSTNNSQERLVTPLVDRLQGEITPQAREQLLAPYSERKS